MGRRGNPIPAGCKKYGVPLYCASWIPLHEIQQQNEADNSDKETLQSQQSYYLVLGGGGGEGRSGIPNALLFTQFDFSSASLSDQPVDKLTTEGDLPYRMAVHPRGEGLVCSFPNTCRWFEWDGLENKEDQKVALKSSEKVLRGLENVGLQLALAFNSDGSMLASGGEDGHLRVFKWPSMEVLLDQPDAHASVKDLDFSSDGKFLACLGSSGPCRVWDLTSLEVVANLPRQNGEMFGFCRFSLHDDDNQLLYVTTTQGKQGGVVSWNTRSWNRGGLRRIVRDRISAFNVSFDGKHLAIGTIEGDIVITKSNAQIQTTVKKAHLGSVTTLAFSHDSRAVVSTSFDSSARVTIIKDKKRSGLSMWAIILIILFAVMVYFAKEKWVF